MIDRQLFDDKMATLSRRLRAPIDASVFDEYFSVLNAELSTQAFEKGWEELYRGYQGQGTLPAPNRFIEAAHGTPRERAIMEWNSVVAYAAQNVPILLSTTAGMALAHIGGTEALKSSTPAERSMLREDFIGFYELQLKMTGLEVIPTSPGGLPRNSGSVPWSNPTSGFVAKVAEAQYRRYLLAKKVIELALSATDVTEAQISIFSQHLEKMAAGSHPTVAMLIRNYIRDLHARKSAESSQAKPEDNGGTGRDLWQ